MADRVSVGAAVAAELGVFDGAGSSVLETRTVGVLASSSTAITCTIGCVVGFSTADWFRPQALNPMSSMLTHNIFTRFLFTAPCKFFILSEAWTHLRR